jgi:hypothetical protein
MAAPTVDVLLVAHRPDVRATAQIADRLAAMDLHVQMETFGSEAIREAVDAAGAVGLVIGEDGDPAEVLAIARLVRDPDRLFLVILPGSASGPLRGVRGALEPATILDLSRGIDDGALDRVAKKLRSDLDRGALAHDPPTKQAQVEAPVAHIIGDPVGEALGGGGHGRISKLFPARDCASCPPA